MDLNPFSDIPFDVQLIVGTESPWAQVDTAWTRWLTSTILHRLGLLPVLAGWS